MIWLKQSTAVVISMGPFLLNTDGVTLVTNLVGTGSNQTENTSTGIRISKNGGAFAARHATATASTYDAFGNYLVTLDTTDTGTLGPLRMQFANGAAFCPVWMDFMIVPANAWDSMFGSDLLQVDVTQLLNTAWLTPGTAGTPDVNVKLWNALTTVELPLVPTTAGRKLDVSTGGEAGVDWANVGSPTTTLALTGTTVAPTQKVDLETIKTNPVVNGGTVTFPTSETLASTTNITAGTIATVTNLTNAPTVGDLTGTMKSSVQTAATASLAAFFTSAATLVAAIWAAVTRTLTTGVALETTAQSIKTKTDLIPASPAAIGSAMTLTSGERNSIADAYLDRTDGVESGMTPRQQMRLSAAADGGKTSGMESSTVVIRDAGDTKDRIVADVDEDGNRSSVTLDLD